MSAGSGSTFPHIDADHPLAEAVRAIDTHVEQGHDLDAVVEWLDLGMGAGELAYLAEQRVLRAIAADRGDVPFGEQPARRALESELWRDIRTRMVLMSILMDGILTGWKGHELSSHR